MYPSEGDNADEEDDLDRETDSNEGHEDEARRGVMLVLFEIRHGGHNRRSLSRGSVKCCGQTGDKDRTDSSGETYRRTGQALGGTQKGHATHLQ